MYGSELYVFSFWWIVLVVMMIPYFFIMRGPKETMMNGFGCLDNDWQRAGANQSANDILDRRYTSGEIETKEKFIWKQERQ